MDNAMDEKNMDAEYYTLVDEEGTETEFEVIGSAEIKGTYYYAMIPAGSDESAEISEYVILKTELDENGEEMLVTIDDDDEFEDVAEYFDDLFSSEIDYDA